MINSWIRSLSVLAAAVLAVAAVSNAGVARADQAPPPPIVVVIFPSAGRVSNSLEASLARLRDELRSNPRIEALGFDPDAPTFILAAHDAGLDVTRVATDDDRTRLAQSLGAQLCVTVSGGKGADPDGGSNITASIRAVKAAGPQPDGVTTSDASVRSAAQIVDEQVMVIDAARDAASKSAAPPPAAETSVPVSVSSPPNQPSAVSETLHKSASSEPAAQSPSQIATGASQSSAAATTVSAAAPVIAPASNLAGATQTQPAPSTEATAAVGSNEEQSTPTPVTSDAQDSMQRGDDALAHANTDMAIEDYRRAVDFSPRNADPRIKLAKAYLAAGDSDRALDELRRAVEVDPDSTNLKEYIEDISKQGLLPGADTILLQIDAKSHPNDPSELLSLGDAYWNGNRLDLAEQCYIQASKLPACGLSPYARLARLYAATGRYDECLAALRHSGDSGYPAALRIIKGRAETLIGDIDSAVQQFKTGAPERTSFYDAIKKDDANAAAYAAFIGKIVPPAHYKVTYLHRLLAANLLAQTTPNLENYALTGDVKYLNSARDIERSAEQELSDANIADKLQQAVTSGQ